MKKIVIAIACLMTMQNFAQKSKTIQFNPIEISRQAVEAIGDFQIDATQAKFYQFDPAQLLPQLDGITNRSEENSGFVATIDFPFPDGTMHTFNAKANNTMSAELAKKFPEIKSYDASGVDQVAFVKWDITPQGLHAMIMSPNHSTVYIDPVIKGNNQYYIVYHKKDFISEKLFDCGVIEQENLPSTPSSDYSKANYASCELRTYRIAIAATGEYTTHHGGTVPLAQAAQVTTMNRVNGIYERDMAITMTIIGNNNQIIYTNASTDPYTNGSAGVMLGENQTTVDNVIGNSNYDIGHVFGTNSGGVAMFASVCNNFSKARGVTGSSNPVNDPFDIDYVAHEVGHQFGASHTFNNSCSGNRSDANAVEPGSGSTIMAYAGICAPNVQNNSDDHFSGNSLRQIGTFISSASHTCPVTTALSNVPPVISATNGNVTVPANTPFALTATASDSDGDPITYNWEQMDNEISTQPPLATNADGPNFRSFPSSTNPTRYFPNLTSLSNGSATPYEVIPSVSRTMNFRVTVRDNASGNGGCSDYQDLTVTVDGNSGPFVVQVPSASGISYPEGSTQTVTWDVANTNQAPVSCANVDILLSADGGQTYPFVLATNVPNDGSHDVVYPLGGTNMARVMVTCTDRSFFDISNRNFSIVGTGSIGLTENHFENLKVSPNPTSDFVKVELDGDFVASIYDSRGKLILSESGIEELTFDMSVFQSGMYYLEIQSKGLKQTVKLVNQ